jgi:hypothetical protein
MRFFGHRRNTGYQVIFKDINTLAQASLTTANAAHTQTNRPVVHRGDNNGVSIASNTKRQSYCSGDAAARDRTVARAVSMATSFPAYPDDAAAQRPVPGRLADRSEHAAPGSNHVPGMN